MSNKTIDLDSYRFVRRETPKPQVQPPKKKKDNNKIIVRLIIVIASLIVIAVVGFVGVIFYQEYQDNKETELYNYVSDDGTYTLDIVQIGSIEEPYGPTNCEFKLYKDGILVNKYKFIVLNDGDLPASEDFNVSFEDERVKVMVSGEDQRDKLYYIVYSNVNEQSTNNN